jgi:hypothetical protein
MSAKRHRNEYLTPASSRRHFNINYDLREARDRAKHHGRTEEQVHELRKQAAQSATCCGCCFRALKADDSVTMRPANIGHRKSPHWVRVPVCLLCSINSIRIKKYIGCDPFYETPSWHRTRCLNCGRPIRVYAQPRNMFRTRPLLSRNARTCCADCQRAVRNQSNKLRRRVVHEPTICMAPGCGKSFVPKRSDTTTCSGKCRQALFRQRQAERQAERASVKHPLRKSKASASRAELGGVKHPLRKSRRSRTTAINGEPM